ncbi:DUF2848 family protein [Oceanobacillus aidingensis]|uniref:DUF2848 family protein n=1 Tax=Oceanobacillus aidingensis TaxID=645964 RepID=A0ABV9JSJ8_9BACI
MSKKQFYCIGYAGRDKKKTWEHVEELKKIGVPEPKSVPELYHLSDYLIDNSGAISVIGNQTSGEVEIVLICDEEGNLFVTVGSDHTDRGLETVSIHKSKQVCAKPIAGKKWGFEDVQDEWDDLVLYSEVLSEGNWVKYQHDKVSSIIPFEQIMDFLKRNDIESQNYVVYCGTVPLLNGFIYGDGFRCGIYSEKMDKTIELEYKVEKLKV